MSENKPHDPAFRRYQLLQLARLGAIAVVMAGVLILSGRVIDAPEWLGSVLFAGGAIAFFFVPRHLARRWKSDARK